MRKMFASLFSVVLLLGVILAVGCGGGGGGGDGSPVAPTLTNGALADLAGTVTYLGKVVPNASVYLLKPADQPASLKTRASVMAQPKPDYSVLTADGNGYQTLSDAEGKYLFSQVPVGTYTLVAMADPTTQISQSVVLGAISSLDLALKPTGNITGKIVYGYVDPYNATQIGDPVSGELFGLQGTPYMSWTQSDGSITFNNIPVTTVPYTIVPVYQNWIIFKSAPVTITPVAGSNTPFGTQEVVSAKTTIKGIAKLPTGTDFSNIYVTTSRGGSTNTKSDGSYQITDVYFGKVVINYSRYYAGQQYTAQQTVTVDSLATMTVPDVTLALMPVAPTTAKVDVGLAGLISGGSYVQFQLWKEGDTSYSYYGSNNQPATSSYNLLPGTWYVKIMPGADYTLLNPAPGSTDLIASQTVVAGGNASFVAQLQYTKASLSGTITGLDSSYPLNYAYLYPEGYNSYADGGTFSFTGVTPGVKSLVISGPGYQTFSTAVTLVTGNNTANVTITPIFPTLTSAMLSGSTITVGGTRFDVSTASILVTSSDGSSNTYSPTTRSATTMTLDATVLSPGAYTIKAQGQDGALSTNYDSVAIPFSVGPTINTGVIGTGSYTLNWSYLSGATEYEVRQVSPIPGSYISTSDYSHTFTGLQPNMTYTFGVRALGSGGIYSPENTVTITTYKVFATPVPYDSGISVSNPVRSFLKNGFLYVLDENAAGVNYYLVKYDLNSPTIPAQRANILYSPGSTVRPTELFVDSSYVYVGWASGTSAILQQYENLPTLPATPLRTFSKNFYSLSQGGIKVMTDPNNTGQLAVFTWGMDLTMANVAAITYLSPSTLTQTGSEIPMNISTPPNEFQWCTFTGSDGSTPYVAMLSSAVAANSSLVVYDKFFNTKYDNAPISMPSDLTSSPNTGYVWVDSSMHYRNTPATFGVQLPVSGQVCMDSNNRYYIYSNTSGYYGSLSRYSPKGSLIDSTEFLNEFPGMFGKKLIHYDDLNKQIVIITRGPSGNMQALTFSTQD